MADTRAAVERAMRVQEAILAGIEWAANLVAGRRRGTATTGCSDHRRRWPSPRAAPLAEVHRLVRLYRERYGPRARHPGFNVRHFYQVACRDHRVRRFDSVVLQLDKQRGRRSDRVTWSPRGDQWMLFHEATLK